jgi:hypothetical protein
LDVSQIEQDPDGLLQHGPLTRRQLDEIATILG